MVPHRLLSDKSNHKVQSSNLKVQSNMKYGFIKVASAIPAVKVGDVIFNTQQIENQIAQAEGKGVEIITFPELSITGYSCQDLFRQQMLLE